MRDFCSGSSLELPVEIITRTSYIKFICRTILQYQVNVSYWIYLSYALIVSYWSIPTD